MLGRTLWEKGTYYNKKRVTDEDIDFYERLYVNSDLSQVSKLIPFTALTTMREQASSHDQKRLKNTILALRLTRIDNILTKDEDVYREYYFASFDVEIERMYRLRMSDMQSQYEIFYRQSFPPSEYIKTPDKWAAQMRGYLHDERLENYRAVLDFLRKYDTDTDFIRSQLLPRLDGGKSWRDVNHALMLMSQRERLRADPELRRRAQHIEKTHLFTIVRAATRHVLTDSKISAGLRQPYITGYFWRDDDEFIEINKTRRFCEPPDDTSPSILSARPDLPEFPEFDYLTQYYLGATYSVHSVKRTSNGWLAGYNAGEFGGGLVYYPDGATQGVIILRGTPHNVIRIIKSDKEGVYWVLTGLSHMMDYGSVVHRLEIKNDDVKSDIVKQLPKTPEKTFVTKDGDLFIDFWHRSYATSDENMQTTTHLNSKYKYNPPLLFTKTGELLSACETTALH
ncbi:MAG: hypothetical protein JKX72_05870 [Robiginitomaculum sp.]|nr:hypothetical protein [Robiginitomaculum sp.]